MRGKNRFTIHEKYDHVFPVFLMAKYNNNMDITLPIALPFRSKYYVVYMYIEVSTSTIINSPLDCLSLSCLNNNNTYALYASFYFPYV